MENAQDSKTRVKHPDRVTLNPEALSRLAEWLGELEGHLKGSRVTKSDLVTFLVLSHPAHLSEREIEQLKSQHFDEVRFAEWALRQLKAAKSEGKNLSLAEIMHPGHSNPAGPETDKRTPETRLVSPKNREKIQG
jgi:hypothetical protein